MNKTLKEDLYKKYIKINIDQLTGLPDRLEINKDFNLLPEVGVSLLGMFEKAKNDGLDINIASGYRDFARQSKIWNNKFDKLSETISDKSVIIKDILNYLALPGTSRHHWGTDVDIVGKKFAGEDLLLEKNYLPGGVYADLYIWLSKYSTDFGFYEVYTNNRSRPGFKFEPWHFSYRKISTIFTKKFLTQDWTSHIDWSKVKGAELLDKDFLKDYSKNFIAGINKILID